MSKEVFDFLANILFLSLAFRLNQKFSRFPNMSWAALLLNFYFFVLLLPAEKLKFAIILLMALLLLRKKMGVFVLSISTLAHFQILVNLLISVADSTLSRIRTMRFSLKNLPLLMFAVPIGFALSSRLFSKAFFYVANADIDLLDPIKVGIWGVVGVFVARKQHRQLLIVSTILLMTASVFVGSDRLVIVAYFYFFFWVIQRRSVLSLAVFFVSSTYFAQKSAFFLAAVLATGDGFNY